MKRHARVWVPLLILLVGGIGVALLIVTKSPIDSEPPDVAAPLVRVVRVEPRDVQFVVRAHGTVTPRTESELVPQVSGEVVWVSASLASGGFFEAGEPLLRIDSADYEVARESARAAVARASSELARARKELDRQRELAERAITSEARIDDAENAFRVAEAERREAQASLERAERDLARTELVAPYTGRVREESVDVGQFVSRGSPVAILYAVDRAEVRLPVPDRELSYLDLPLAYRAESAAEEPGPSVRLRAEFAGREHTWTGEIVRTEGEIDAKSRMVHVVARVDDPYGMREPREGPPLAVGLFVSAEILGRRVEDAVVLPRAALRDGSGAPGRGQVLVVDAEDRLRFREVGVLRSERDHVVIGDGLVAGERVCVSPLGAAVDGMSVRAVDGESPASVAELRP